MIIDNHVHIGSTEKLRGRHMTLQSYSETMFACGVDKAAVMPNLSDINKSSELNRQIMKDYYQFDKPDIYYPLILADPRDSITLHQMEGYKDDIYGIKYHPSVSDCAITDSSMEQFIEVIGDLKLPVLIHCGRYWKSYIDYILDSAKANPSIIFIAAHLGGNAINQAFDAINKVKELNLSNLYFDTSSIKQPWLVELAAKEVGVHKMLFGSDEPYADLRINKLCVELADIPDKDKEQIFYKTFERVFGD